MQRGSAARTAWLVWMGILAGCASVQPGMDRGPLDDSDAPSAIAVLVQATPPEASFATPAYSESIAGGALVGAAGGALAGYTLAPLALLGGPAALAAFAATAAAIMVGSTVAGTAVGAAAGAAVVVPPEEVAAVKRALDQAIADLRLPELTASALAADVGRWTPYRADVLDDRSGGSPKDAAYYRSLRARGFGAAVDLRLVNVGFAGRGGSDPGIALILTAEAQLVDTTTGSPASLRGLVYLSAARDESAWVRKDGALAKAEAERACRMLAERIVESVILRADIDINYNAPPPPYTCGLVPTRPKPEGGSTIFVRAYPETLLADSRNPLLAWDRLPTPITVKDERRFAAIEAEDARYDLRIWKSVDEAPAEIVYERDGLESHEHRVDTPLEAGTTYFWSVRMRFREHGQPRASRWSASIVPPFRPPLPLDSALYYSRLENGVLSRVPCGQRDLTPCGCLDFIPRQNLYRFRTP